MNTVTELITQHETQETIMIYPTKNLIYGLLANKNSLYGYCLGLAISALRGREYRYEEALELAEVMAGGLPILFQIIEDHPEADSAKINTEADSFLVEINAYSGCNEVDVHCTKIPQTEKEQR